MPYAPPSPRPIRGAFREIFWLYSSAYGRQRVHNVTRLAAKLLGEASDDAELFELAQQTLVAFDRRAISTILRRGIKRGELRQDTNVAVATDILHGTLIYRTLLVDRSLAGVPPSYFRRLVDVLLAGIGSPR